MVTYETLKTYLEKVQAEMADTEENLAKAKALVARMEKKSYTLGGQIVTLQGLMNIEESPPVVEMPLVDEETMQENFDKRLDFFPGKDPEEFFEHRQEVSYKREADETLKKVHELNELNDSEV